MKTADLFNIILKVFGLLVLKDIIFQLPYLITPIMAFIQNGSTTEGLGILIVSLVIFALYFSLAHLLLFKTEVFMNLFKLDNEFFATDLSLNVSKRNVIAIALVCVCGFILIDEIPNLCRYLFRYYELKQLHLTELQAPTADLIVTVAKLVIASLLIGERKKIVEFITREEAAIPEDEQL